MAAAAAMPGEERAAARRGHPLLRGGARRDEYTHGLRPAQMEALRAICGAFIPSLPEEAAAASEEGVDGGRGGRSSDKDLERFYVASAADSTIPDEVTDHIGRSFPSKFRLFPSFNSSITAN
ncbi:hypothetical protein ABZP36_012201 [Zizania latifolia]